MMDDDRIAIVGLACRVPGAEGPAEFWANLTGGIEAVRRFSAIELIAAGLPAETAEDASFVPAFGRLAGLTDFDAALFGYSAADAALLDPQHRLFLEVAWWALEDGGHGRPDPETQVGVFAGCAANRYLRHHLLGNPAVHPAGSLLEDWDELLAGGTCDYLPSRVAYALGLTGPAVAVQTSCSSSLVSVCQAAQSLLDYRCDLAIAGGAAVVSTRQVGYRHRPGGTLAADGVCRPYDADASGQVFGNGAGAVLLKRLADAVEDDDHIYGVLAGWAVNNDGAARAGFTAPGVTGQAAVVAEALAAAGWQPTDVGFVEGHGSGTAIGDALEIEALTRAFRMHTDRSGYCVLGSVKSGIGNLDAAAGVVGLIKAVLAVGHGVIPGTLHFRRPHRDVDLAATPFVVTATEQKWAGPRRAGVSSFGLGGTNAHVLVEEPPVRPAADAAPPWALLPLSAAGPRALRRLAGRLADHLDTRSGASLTDAAYTLATGRRRLPHRAAVVARDLSGAVAALRSLATGPEPAEGRVVASVPADAPAELGDRAGEWLRGGGVPAAAGRRVPLPGYPFQRDRHWIEPLEATRLTGARP
ncbi:type I polyketide synthase [Micromonospora sp. 4G57]|uniref:Type I polyketide synthase n=1 Tax=Micromonospora sicca TaxID=2202420 RepID=A0ABU5J942_9ACTN|nr:MULTISPECIES: type I polyketide synthase [unclassified Micromonospora]MDZ5442294.1 type I polyketide synthase [Micromonospora sp. 4G57]MDZ5489099.1 type I polyketide synthase [Micromonospora sp. 4G53]